MTPNPVSSLGVSQLLGVSLRQLQWWDDSELIVPSQINHRRHYSPLDVLEVALLTRLRSGKVSLQWYRKHQAPLKRAIRSLDQSLNFVLAIPDYGEFRILDGPDQTWEFLRLGFTGRTIPIKLHELALRLGTRAQPGLAAEAAGAGFSELAERLGTAA